MRVLKVRWRRWAAPRRFVKAAPTDYSVAVTTPPWYILSDCHVGAAPAATTTSLVQFLRRLRGEEGSLILNGDILDFWFEWRRSIPTFALPVLGALGELRAAGMPITWIAGNHDCWGGAVLREQLGITYQTTPLKARLGAWNVEIEHGDGLRGKADAGYLRIRPLLRHPLSLWAFRLLHPDLGTRLALGTSEASRVHTAADSGQGLRDVALERVTRAGGPNLVVFGHSHVAELTRAPNGGVYANPGGWGEVPRYLKLTDARIDLIELTASGEDRRLDSVQGRADEALSNPLERLGGVGRDESMRTTGSGS